MELADCPETPRAHPLTFPKFPEDPGLTGMTCPFSPLAPQDPGVTLVPPRPLITGLSACPLLPQ